MKKIVSHFGSSSYVQFVTGGITLLLATLAVVVPSATSAPRDGGAGSPGDKPVVGQENPWSYAGVGAQEKFQPTRIAPKALPGPVNVEEVDQSGPIPASPTSNPLINNNTGSTGTSFFTQSETTIVAFGNTIVAGFNDSGSFNGSNQFTGWSRSTDGGATWTDGGKLPASAGGDAGDPVLARNNTTGRIYFATLGSTNPDVIQVFRSDNNGASWQAPVNGTPSGSSEDKEWITVDNFPGSGNGNVYLVARNFGAGNGIYFTRSTDDGTTFGPNGGTLIVAGNQGAFVTVGPGHVVYVFWYAGATLQVRKSTDQGVTFAAPVQVASGLIGGTNGDLGLTGLRQGTGSFSLFRTNEFPHAAVNPVSGNIYVTFDNKGTGTDKAEIFFVQSTNGGATWSAPVKVNDDATATDQWMPTVAVSPTGDKLGIFYYSRQEDTANNNLFKRYGRIATISGGTVTFTPSFAVSDTASLPEFGRDSVVNSTYMGDYDQVYATSDAFHMVWSDNRSNLPGGAPRKDPNVYYNRVTLTPPTPTTFNNLIVNAGFETGSFSPWVIDGNHPTPVVTTAQHHSGTRSALLGNLSEPAAIGDSSFYQQITVPAAGGTLSYWWWGGTTDSIAIDSQDAYVTNTSNTILATISHTAAATGGWVHKTFDMTPFAGQTVRIKFLVHQSLDTLFPTWMYVDDVQVTSPNANYVLYNASTRATAVWRLNNNVFAGGVFGPTLPASWSLVGAADFNGNLNPDYLLFNASTRQTAIWYLSGTAFVSGAFGPTLPSGWVLVAVGDFNGDGKPDYVLYNTGTRQTAVWYMNNNVLLSGALGPTLPAGWSLVGVADFNQDGHPDYLLFNASTRQTAIWYLSGTTFLGGVFGPTIASGYQLTGVADFNEDGYPDYVLYNPSTRQTAIWYMNNNVFDSGAFGPTLAVGWSLVDALPSVP
jgi:hypothetical protein